MRILTHLLLSGILLTAISVPAVAGVNVNFVEPEKYTDLRQNEFKVRPDDRDRILSDLRAYLESLGSELGPDQSLTVDVLDIDLAGQTEVVSSAQQDERLARDFTGPSMKVKYVFEDGGQVIASAEETIQDQNYLSHPTLRTSSDPLRYEKYMLENWFRQRFVKRDAPME